MASHSSYTPAFIANLGLGLAAWSLTFWGKLGLRLVGVAPLISSSRRRDTAGLGYPQAIKSWAWFSGSASLLFFASGLMSAACRNKAAEEVPKVLLHGPELHRLLIGGGSWTRLKSFVGLFSRGAYGRLYTDAKANLELSGNVRLYSYWRRNIQEDLDRWSGYNDLRIVLAGIAWAHVARAVFIA